MTEETKPEVKTVPITDFEKEQEKRRRYEAENEDLRRQVKEFGMSPKEVQALRSQYDEMKKNDAVGDPKKFEEELNRRIADVRQSVQKDLDNKQEWLSKAQARIKELEVTDRVFSLAANKFNDDTHDDVKSLIRKFGDLSEDGSIIFKDETGKPRYAPGSTTQLMKPEQFVEWVKEIKPSWAKPTAISGSKQEGSKVNGSAMNGKTYTAEMFATMSQSEINQIVSSDPVAARAYLSTVKLS
jgi:hypothetical protein